MIVPSLLTFLIPLSTHVHATSYSTPDEFAPWLPPRSGSPRIERGPSWTRQDPCPSKIHARLDASWGDSFVDKIGCRFNDMNTIHSTLTHCPRVEELNLHLESSESWHRGYEWDSCGWSSVERFDFPFDPKGRDRFPALKRLRLDGYQFGGPWVDDPACELDVELQDKCMQNRTAAEELVQKQRNERIEKENGTTNLAQWLKAMDWGELEELAINWARNPEMSVVEELPKDGRLKSLKKLEITNAVFIEALDYNTLTDLKWLGRTQPGELPSILAHQGQSLQSLEYRCDELACPDFPSTFNISVLPTLAPQLQHLSINLPRNGSWPLKDLDAIASLPHLQTLNLYFRMQSDCHTRDEAQRTVQKQQNWHRFHPVCSGPASYSSPYVNRSTATAMFVYLRAHKKGAQLQSTTFYTGDWSNPYDPHSRIHPYMAHRRSQVQCTVDQGGETCKAENDKYWLDRWGWESEYRDEEGGKWFHGRWSGPEEEEEEVVERGVVGRVGQMVIGRMFR
ncbi:hypothetical protein N0V94_002474 [Neodidymelliopsis sp. IMI 364377]|nr:hypothetical protein N0V94_002474 [Neodidymelliopsis sp. IMI 364377]